MCVEKWVQNFFFPYAAAWTTPAAAASLEALDAAVLRRLRYLAVVPACCAVWSVAALALGGASPTRLGTLGGSLVQTGMLIGTCA